MRMGLSNRDARAMAQEMGFLHDNKSDLDINKFVRYLYTLQGQLNTIEASLLTIQTIEMEHVWNDKTKRQSSEDT